MRSISEIDCVSTGSFNFQQRKVGRDSNFNIFNRVGNPKLCEPSQNIQKLFTSILLELYKSCMKSN